MRAPCSRLAAAQSLPHRNPFSCKLQPQPSRGFQWPRELAAQQMAVVAPKKPREARAALLAGDVTPECTSPAWRSARVNARQTLIASPLRPACEVHGRDVRCMRCPCLKQPEIPNMACVTTYEHCSCVFAVVEPRRSRYVFPCRKAVMATVFAPDMDDQMPQFKTAIPPWPVSSGHTLATSYAQTCSLTLASLLVPHEDIHIAGLSRCRNAQHRRMDSSSSPKEHTAAHLQDPSFTGTQPRICTSM